MQGARVLASRPAEAERALAFAGLGDLLDGVLDDVLPLLTPPRRRALEVALLVEEASEAVDPRALGVAVRSALETLAAEEALVLAIDDVQWLDAASEDAVVFALRRVERPVALLLARRLAAGIAPSRLENVVTDAVTVPIGPLSIGAVQRLIRERLDRAFPRTTLVRVHEMSGGNPFYALELARALPEKVAATEPLPVPETLEELVAARLAGLPDETQSGLALAAAIGSPTTELLASAGVESAALEPALEAHVIERRGPVLAFTHPLLASALYQGLARAERRRIHASLAEVVPDPLERARHLALATEEHEEPVAAQLEAAQALAFSRGAWSLAAELGEHARRLTPPGDETAAHRRAIGLARAHLESGSTSQAAAICDELLAGTARGTARAEALVVLSDVRSWTGDLDGFVEARLEALQEARDDPALRAEIHARLAAVGRISRGLQWAEGHARLAVELADSVGDDALRAKALAALAVIRFNRGEPDGARLAERARELALGADDATSVEETTAALGHVLTWSGSLARARDLLESEIDEWSARNELRAGSAAWYLALVEHRAGRLARAAELARTAWETNTRYDVEHRTTLFPLALVAASQGDLALARESALRHALPVLCLVEYWGGDTRSAIVSFEKAERRFELDGFGEPSFRWWRADYAEALLELGRIDDAVALLDDWENAARRVDRAWVLAQVARCRGLVAAARGEIDSALELLAEAALAHEQVEDPIGRARALLALGVVRRRARQKRAAREAIEEALALFEECGADGFAEKARAELGHIGGRRREEGLTAAEQRVAALVAEGRTNREVAAALVLGERTVESHLTHIYAKLGVRSRTELARVYEPVS